jgi:hypothetical protein
MEKMEKAGKLTSFPVHQSNPYLSSLVVPTRNKVVQVGNPKEFAMVNTDTGEEHSMLIGTKHVVDKEEFRKIFKGNIKTLFCLSSAGIKAFGYFLDALHVSKDQVLFDLEDCMKFTGYTSKASIYSGVSELLKNNFIARTHKAYTFFINPAIFFNGSRLVMVNEYVVQQDKKTTLPKPQLDLFEQTNVPNDPNRGAVGKE